MLTKKQIRKLAKLIYPSSLYKGAEKRHLRVLIAEEIQEYCESHPDAAYDDVKQHFCDTESLAVQHKLSSRNILKVIIPVGFVLLLLCIIFYCISNTWEPPTYVF